MYVGCQDVRVENKSSASLEDAPDRHPCSRGVDCDCLQVEDLVVPFVCQGLEILILMVADTDADSSSGADTDSESRRCRFW